MSKPDSRQLNGVSEFYKARLLAARCIAPSDKEFEGLYPNLFSVLSDTRVDVDKVCEPARLSISNNAGDWLIALSISSIQAYGSITATTIKAGLEEVERLLGIHKFPMTYSQKRKPRIRDLEKQK